MLVVSRLQRSEAALGALACQIKGWLVAARALDDGAGAQKVLRHRAQLTELERFLRRGVETLLAGVERARAATDAREVYRECLQLDRGTAWLERVWHYFRARYDQRRDPALQPLLDAADDVLWSCYRPLTRPEGTGLLPPLSFIEPQESFWAFESVKPLPADIKSQIKTMDPGLAALVGKIPLPLVALPPWLAVAPWWLVYLGHEAGHHVMYDRGLDKAFRELVDRCAEASKASRTYWISWMSEVFADVFSVLVMGAAAVDALVEATLHDPAEKTQGYPPPVVRLELLCSALEALTLTVPASAAALPRAPKESTDVDVVTARAIAEEFVAQKGNALAQLRADFLSDASAYQKRVAECTSVLVSDRHPPPRAVDAARVLAAAAVQRWRQLAPLTDASTYLGPLGTRLLTSIAGSAPEETRASMRAPVVQADVEDFARLLLSPPKGVTSGADEGSGS